MPLQAHRSASGRPPRCTSAADVPATPWRNGGGTTCVLLAGQNAIRRRCEGHHRSARRADAAAGAPVGKRAPAALHIRRRRADHAVAQRRRHHVCLAGGAGRRRMAVTHQRGRHRGRRAFLVVRRHRALVGAAGGRRGPVRRWHLPAALARSGRIALRWPDRDRQWGDRSAASRPEPVAAGPARCDMGGIRRHRVVDAGRPMRPLHARSGFCRYGGPGRTAAETPLPTGALRWFDRTPGVIAHHAAQASHAPVGWWLAVGEPRAPIGMTSRLA